MKFLFRSTLLLALLASLAYGSYAFGRYVLSHYLFTEGVKANPNSVIGSDAIAASVGGGVTEGNYKGTKPQANVRVLSAEADGAGPQAPSSESLERETRAVAADANPVTRDTPPPSSIPQDSDHAQEDRTTRPRSGGKNDVLTGGYRGSLRAYDDDDEESSTRRRSRRHRRRRDTNRETTDAGTQTNTGTTGSTGSASDGGSINDRPVSEEPRRSEPRRAEPRSSEPRRAESRPPARRVPSNDSPVPVPERSGGGDSPVPVPE